MPVPEKNTFKYRAFLSYSHKDEKSARWLHRALESFHVPEHLVADSPSGPDILRSLAPVFRDRDELPSAASLSQAVTQALQDSESLVIVCSPAAAQSRWVNEEIKTFKELGRAGRIFCYIVDGEPNVGGEQECFPEALRFEPSPNGDTGLVAVEPLAADARPQGDHRTVAKLRLIAGLLGVGFDELRQRDLLRRNRSMMAITAGSMLVAVITIGLAIVAYLSNAEAERRRAQAEDLVGFMLGDLQEGLHEIGRLDIFMRVGNKAMEYFAALADEKDISDDSLSQRARALRQIGEARNDHGDTALALESFRESLIIAQRLADRNPDNSDWQIALANSHFYIGHLHMQRDELEDAKREFETVLPIVNGLSAREPEETEWIVERGYANTNLARVLELQGRLEEALQLYMEVKSINDSLAQLQPDNLEYQLEVGFAHNNIGKVAGLLGRLDEAETHYRKDLEIKLAISAAKPDHNTWRGYLATSHRFMGRILFAQGLNQEARRQFLSATDILQQLLLIDTERTDLKRQMALSRLELARIHRFEAEAPQAEEQLIATLEILDDLLLIDANNANWQREHAMILSEQGELLRSIGEPQRAAVAADVAITALTGLLEKEPGSLNTAEQLTVANLRMGDIQQDLGQAGRSRSHWQRAADRLENDFPGQSSPNIIDLRSALWLRLGRQAEAERAIDHLAEMGYQRRF